MVAKSKKRLSMPTSISPMLCTLVKEMPTSDEYLFELKWDGYRIISQVEDGKVKMNSRGGLDYTQKYPPVAKALASLSHDVILDGEVVVFNEEGKPDFDALQLYNGHNSPIQYCVFDLLWLKGQQLMELPLVQRKELLKVLVEGNAVLRFSESFENGAALYKHSLEENLEGIVAKQKDSTYSQGARGNAWLKIPTKKRQEFVIGGWAESTTSRSFKSLLFGAYENGEFMWIGRSGGGYKHKEMPAILEKLKQHETDESPFANKVLDTKGAKIHWMEPKLVANFEFATWTKSGRIRKPATFLGFRNDKNASDVVREVPKEAEIIEEEIQEQPAKQNVELAEDSNWRKILEEKIKSEGDIDINGHSVHLTNIEKNLWKGVNKAALISYYNSVAEHILPYLKDRPLSLHIKNLSATAPGFYIKDMEGMQPEYAEIFTTPRKHKKKGKRDVIDYIVCNNQETLIYLANLGCIDFNPWNSRVQDPLHPDYIAIDLDPSDGDFQKAVTTAKAAKAYFDHLKLKAFVKTSGKTGIHIFIPCKGFTYAKARSLAEHICKEIHLLVPDITTIEVSIDHRGDKLFVDFSQNDEADTLASAYSVRPSKKPTVSAPLEWKELTNDLTPEQFTIDSMFKRIDNKGDLFRGIFDAKIKSANANILNRIITNP